ncbi:MAG: exodeoxyribonuclease V subunit beta [Neisseriaceae bacterium]|nr:exodeoxyribonuclease V subunit beta [Neisseriaceae bacterium]
MKHFDPFDIPITGSNLIEASAGTGKTYGIASIFARLLIVEKFSIAKIAVLTFTKAAAAELKNRLRSRLVMLSNHQSFADFQAAAQNDSFLNDLLFRLPESFADGGSFADGTHSSDEAKWQIIQARARHAVERFDSVTIDTIHGFCKRVLSDDAFLCGTPFQWVLDEYIRTQKIRQMAEDFWRSEVANDAASAKLVMEQGLTWKKLFDDVKKYIGQPEKTCHLPPIDENIAQQNHQNYLLFEEEYQRFIEQFSQQDALDAIAKIKAKYLNGNSYQERTVSVFWQNFYTKQFYGDSNSKSLQSHGSKFTSYGLALKKDAQKLGHENLDLPEIFYAYTQVYEKFEQYQTTFQAAKISLHYRLLKYLNRQLKSVKYTHSERNFDDLILDLYQALQTPNSSLKDKIAHSWDALIVDEFQDTDAIQYAIFQAAFVAQNKAVYWVGDPKQSIYRFRGADMKTYAAAQNHALKTTMGTNYRTHQALVEAVNQIFDVRPDPFLSDDIIQFQPVKAHRKASRLTHLPAMTWLLPADLQEKIHAEGIRQNHAKICANHIVHVLNQKIPYQNRTLQAGDIAVLVRSNHQAKQIQAALKQCNIASTLRLRENIFSSDEALAMYALMQFWLEPNRVELWRFVFSGCLLKDTAQDLMAFNQNEQQIAQHIEIARQTQDIWRSRGFLSAWRYFNQQIAIETRLIQQRDLRAFGNLLHLIELISQASQNIIGEWSLLAWLQEQIQNTQENSQETEEQQLRLESDQHLVRIVTIHASKGLEYPLVYCPFVNGDEERNNKIKELELLDDELHHKDNIADENQEKIKHDTRAENVRLLYVALTRAAEAVVLIAQNNELEKKNNALDGLLKKAFPNAQKTHEAIVAMVEQSNGNMVFRQPENAVSALSPSPQATEIQDYQAACYQNQNPPCRYQTSFTGWVRQSSKEILYDDVRGDDDDHHHDRQAENSLHPNRQPENGSIHAFPKGAQAGDCLHQILQDFHFHKDASETSCQQMIQQHLKDFSFWKSEEDDVLIETVSHLLNRIRQMDLGEGFALSQTAPHECLKEPSFLTDNWQFKAHEIPDLLPDDLKSSLFRLPEKTLSAAMNGAMDLVVYRNKKHIYLLDYKSNFLGNHDEDYHQQALNQAMREHHYVVQAAIYAVALTHYLKHRMVDDFSLHIRYVFLRGLENSETHGLWSWNIHSGKIQKWMDSWQAT